MSEIHESLQTRIKSLPPLPESIVRIQEICNNPQSSISDLTGVVEKDPMLTANLLKAANSPLYGFSREIKSVGQAISLFGMATVKGFALASAVRQTLKIDMTPYGITPDQFANGSQNKSALMLRWYPKVDRKRMDVLAPASFLDGVGKVIIAAELIKSGKSDAFKAELEGGKEPGDVENSFFETTAQMVSAAVFDHWRFEKELIEAIKASDIPQEASEEFQAYGYALKTIREAVTLDGVINNGTIAKAKTILSMAGLDEKPFNEAIDAITSA